MDRHGDSGFAAAYDETEEPPSSDGPAASPPSYFRFSTDDIPPEGKFETWRDLWMRRLVEVEISTERPEIFSANMKLWMAGPVAIARFDVSKATYERTATLANNGNDDFSFGLCDGVRGHIDTPKGDTTKVKSDGAFLLSYDRRYKVVPSDAHYPFCLLRLDRRALLELLPRDVDIDMLVFAPSEIMALIRHTVPLITNRTEPTTPERRAAIGRQIIDLVALLLNPSREGREIIERRGLRAARMGAVLQSIDRRFADPRLSAEAVGRELRISDRHVHRLLLETTKTFYEHLLERRLQRAHELLSNPLHCGVRIADIASEAGFSSAAYFNQAFRRRFGDSPTGVRAAADTERSLGVLRQSLASAR